MLNSSPEISTYNYTFCQSPTLKWHRLLFPFHPYNQYRGCWSAPTWRRYQMEIFSALLALCEGNSPNTGEFPSQKPVTWIFDVFSDLRLNIRLSTQSRRRWFQTPLRPFYVGVMRFNEVYFNEVYFIKEYFDGLAQHCGNSIANALELLESCAKPSISQLTYALSFMFSLYGINVELVFARSTLGFVCCDASLAFFVRCGAEIWRKTTKLYVCT